MPLTGSHPAAVLPLLGLPALPLLGVPLVPAALVAGSMAPDLPLFVPLPLPTWAAHAPSGIVGVDLALAAALLAAWRALLQPVLLAASPAGLRFRLGPPFAVPTRTSAGGRGPAAGTAALAVSAAAGAATHLGWDAFTHDGRLGVRHIGWLRAAHGPLPGYEWAQYASGVVGAAVLARWAVRWYRRTPPREPPEPSEGQAEPVMPRTAAAAGAAAVVLAATGSGLIAARPWLQRREWAMAGFFGATRGGRGAVLAVVAGGLCWRTWNHLHLETREQS